MIFLHFENSLPIKRWISPSRKSLEYPKQIHYIQHLGKLGLYFVTWKLRFAKKRTQVRLGVV